MTLANHYYLAESKEKAKQYLLLAGNDAVQIHGMEQVYLCFSRLLKIAGDGADDLERAEWSRKVGEALCILERTEEAEQYLFDALKTLRLDCRDAARMNDDETGLFPKQTSWRITLQMEKIKKKVVVRENEYSLPSALLHTDDLGGDAQESFLGECFHPCFQQFQTRRRHHEDLHLAGLGTPFSDAEYDDDGGGNVGGSGEDVLASKVFLFVLGWLRVD